MNILVTAVGSLAGEIVLDILNKEENYIIGTDSLLSKNSTAANLCDRFYKIPNAQHKNYISSLFDISVETGVELIIPLVDYEIDQLDKYRDMFEEKGIHIAMPTNSALKICRDKYNLSQFANKLDKVDAIPTFQLNQLKYTELQKPLIAKLRNGRSSEGLKRITNFNHLSTLSKDYVLQPCIEGAVFTVDAIRDSYGNFFSIAREEIVRTKNGCGLKVKIERNSKLNSLTKKICDALQITGCINIEFIYDGNKYWLMDVNPRFSAGIKFSFLAGYDFITNQVNCRLKKAIDEQLNLKEGNYEMAERRWTELSAPCTFK